MDRGEGTVCLAQLYLTAGCECVRLIGDALLSLSQFICGLSASGKQKGQAGYCHCSLMCMSLAKYTECVCMYRFI